MKGGVRITGGAFRGRHLAVPPGARPTEGRVREALFSIWHDALAGGRCRFLDLFAGSGVVGLEAAGRGALHVLCVDQSAAAVRAIAANAATVGLAGLLEVRRLILPAGLARLAPPATGPGAALSFDLVFADPPYGFAAYDGLLTAVAPLLARDGELAVEHTARRALAVEAGGLVRTGTRRYGESALSFYRHVLDAPSSPGSLVSMPP